MGASVNRPTGWFKEPRDVGKGMNEVSVREVGESMLKDGQLQDVIAQPDGTLIFGHRRLRGQLQGNASSESDGV
jgi:hypothetical protein